MSTTDRVVLAAVAMFALSACGSPTVPPSAPALPVRTSTIVASSTATLSPTSTATTTPVPTSTSTETIEPPATSSPTATPDGPFVSDAFLTQIAGPLRDAIGGFAGEIVPYGDVKNPDDYQFKFMVYDLLGQAMPIVSASGKQLGVSKITAVAVYLTPEGKADWVYFPVITKKNDGTIVAFGDNVISNIDYTDKVVAEVINGLKTKAHWNRGNIKWVDISSTPQKAFNNQNLKDVRQASGDIILGFTLGRESSIQSFITNGNSNDHMLIYPLLVDRNSSPEGTVTLP